MKRTKKILVTLLCAVLLVTGTVAVTVAYLTASTGVVTNTFTVGKVEITLDEADVTEYGVKTSNPRDVANEYKLIPGHNYVKDPTIHVGPTQPSEDVLLFVKVVNGLANIEAATTIENQMLTKGWEQLTGVTNVWYWTGDANSSTVTTIPVAVTDGSDVVVFDEFTLKSDANVEAYTSAKITIEAYAVQADGFEGKTATEVWNLAPLKEWQNNN